MDEKYDVVRFERRQIARALVADIQLHSRVGARNHELLGDKRLIVGGGCCTPRRPERQDEQPHLRNSSHWPLPLKKTSHSERCAPNVATERPSKRAKRA